MVLLVTGHVVGMRHAPGGIDLSRAWVDELRPRLMDGVPVFPKLRPLQIARISCRRPYQLRAPAAVADGVADVLLRDLRVRSARRPHGVGVDFRRADAAGLSRGRTRLENADSDRKNDEGDECSHVVVSMWRRRKIQW